MAPRSKATWTWSGPEQLRPRRPSITSTGPTRLPPSLTAVELNVAPVISISYGGCEVDLVSSALPRHRAAGQRPGDNDSRPPRATPARPDAIARAPSRSPPAACAVQFPAALPEVTGGGRHPIRGGDRQLLGVHQLAQFRFGAFLHSGSSLERVQRRRDWDRAAAAPAVSIPSRLGRPDPACPTTTRAMFRTSLSAPPRHDALLHQLPGREWRRGGTSAAAPSMAGIVALLNQYQVSQGLSESSRTGKHQPATLPAGAKRTLGVSRRYSAGIIWSPCAQGSPDCLARRRSAIRAGPGYDMTTGLGSVDANMLVTQWNTATNGVVVTLSADRRRATLNDTIQLTATVASAAGGGTPTGAVDFVFNTAPPRLGGARRWQRQRDGPSVPIRQLRYVLRRRAIFGRRRIQPGRRHHDIRITAPYRGRRDRAGGACHCVALGRPTHRV